MVVQYKRPLYIKAMSSTLTMTFLPSSKNMKNKFSHPLKQRTKKQNTHHKFSNSYHRQTIIVNQKQNENVGMNRVRYI